MGASSERRLAAAILAGGAARRLGGVDKALLRVGSERIVDRQLARLRAVADPVFIVSGRAEPFRELDVRVVGDAIPGAGALGGIYTAIVASPHPRTLVVACDMPFLAPQLLERLAWPSDADLVIPRSARGFEPLCAAWSVACTDRIRRRIERGDLKAAGVIEDVHVEEIGPELLQSWDPHGLLFVNVNTPRDYERARELGR